MRLAVPFLLALAFTVPAHAAEPQPKPVSKPPATPAGLKPFLLRATEAPAREFPRTPSFAWNPVAGAVAYEFELSTSPKFSESAIVWEKRDARIPAVAPDLALPWITGNPYSLYARVRALSKTSASAWSESFGFNVRWRSVPEMQSGAPGLIRWTPVEGATAYEVLFLNAGHKRIVSPTNVADLREYYTFHQSPFWTGEIRWRVRAVRKLYGEIPNGMPARQYVPWSAVFTTLNTTFSAGPLALGAAVSDVDSPVGDAKPHELTPGFTFTGTGNRMDGVPAELNRVYIATDADCVNVVYRSAIVGSPAYAPRMSGPLALPQSQDKLTEARTKILRDGSEGKAWSFDSEKIKSTEESPTAGTTGSRVDLWDTHWPTGRYYWTVVPVEVRPDRDTDGPTTAIEFVDSVDPQDACRSGLVGTFGKSAKPVVTASGAPYASGLSNGRLLAATTPKPSFFRSPLVAWEPALGADEYEIQWGRSDKPFVAEGKLTTAATSATLCAPAASGTTPGAGGSGGATPPAAPAPGKQAAGSAPPAGAPAAASSCEPLAAGTWYYRVRGLNYGLPKRPGMTWSEPVAVRVTKPSFAVVKK